MDVVVFDGLGKPLLETLSSWHATIYFSLPYVIAKIMEVVMPEMVIMV